MATERVQPNWRQLTKGEAAHFAPLTESNVFRIAPANRETLRIRCTVCGNRWLLPRGNRHGGNILRLLEHRATHVG